MNKTKVHTIYKLMNGERVPSVTTILGILNKPALLDWAWKCGLEGTDYKAVRDNAADIGTLAHYLILCDIKEEEPDTTEYSSQNIEKAENCLIKYWEWGKKHKIEPLMVEIPLVSETHNYGGTIDFYGRVDDVPTLVDFKTGKGVYSEYFYQVAAYWRLLLENGYKVANFRILRIGRDDTEGFEERVLNNMDIHWQIFLNCLEIYRLQKQVKS